MLIEEARSTIDMLYGSPLSVVSDCLRGFLVSKEGYDFIACDFSNIEGRALAWLAGERWKINAFEAFDMEAGPDIYKLSANRIYGKPIDQIDFWERLIGKVAELALGYQGGRGAFLSMAKVYLLKVPEAKADEIKNAWRAAHPKTVNFWYSLQETAMRALYNPEKIFTAGEDYAPIRYRVAGSFLWCSLPSGRVICYPYPAIYQQIWAALKNKDDKTINKTFHGHTASAAHAQAKFYAKENDLILTESSDPQDCLAYMGENSLTNKWDRQIAYGGMLAENVTQAVACDLLRDAMLRVEAANYPIVMHVHDEIVSEVPEDFGSIDEMSEVMTQLPAWAKGLPVTAEGWRDKRYRK